MQVPERLGIGHVCVGRITLATMVTPSIQCCVTLAHGAGRSARSFSRAYLRSWRERKQMVKRSCPPSSVSLMPHLTMGTFDIALFSVATLSFRSSIQHLSELEMMGHLSVVDRVDGLLDLSEKQMEMHAFLVRSVGSVTISPSSFTPFCLVDWLHALLLSTEKEKSRRALSSLRPP